MYKRISNWITSKLIKYKIISSEEKNIYNYCFEVLIATSAILITILFLSIILHKVVPSLFFVLGFIFTRKVSGGYHAKNHFRCFFATIVNYLLYVLTISIIPIHLVRFFQLFYLFISVLFVIFLSPVEDINKPFSSSENKRFKKQSRIYMSIVFVVCLPLSIIKFYQIETFSFIIGLLSVSIYLLFGKAKIYYYKKRKEVNYEKTH